MTSPIAEVLDTDDLRRLNSLYLTFHSLDLEYRGLLMIFDGLMHQHWENVDFHSDLNAVRKIIEDHKSKNALLLHAISNEYQRVKSEKDSQPSKPEEQQTLH
jgi:hypothetical protein